MNTYNENLQNTIINTLNGIYTQQQDLASVQTTAEYTLYHAQGAEITARDKLAATEIQIENWQNINNQAVINNNQIYNLLSSATDIGKVAATSITNTSTAAANVQIASNAISLLASDIGAALNVATASLFETDVYNRIVQANSFINNVANESRSIAKGAMEASAYTSEIISTEVLALAKASSSKIGNVLKSTQPEVNMFSNLAISETQDVNNASVLERQAEGSLSDANSELAAINLAYVQANNQLNMGLTITVLSGFEIQAGFQALPTPLPTFTAPPASKIQIPQANPSYYLTLVPEQNASIFFIDQATQLFQQASNPGSATSGFLTVTPDLPNSPSYVEAVILLTNDAYGQPIQAGQGYVAYIYTELSLPYKQFINNFSDLLSAPSQPFTPATTLPAVQNVRSVPGTVVDAEGIIWSSLQFQAVPLALSADEAAQAAAADATQANNANAAAKLAADNAATAAANIGTSATDAATAIQTAQTNAATAATDAAAEVSSANAAQAALNQTLIANQVNDASNAASVAAAVSVAAVNSANTAFQNLLTARTAVGSTGSGAAGTGSADSGAKGKGKSVTASTDKGTGDTASLSKAQDAAQAFAAATEALPGVVSAAETAASATAIAANNAAIVVTLLDPTKAPTSDQAILNLAIAMAVANAANAAAGTTAAASATAAQASAAAAVATANGSMSASDANNAALAAASAAQISNAAATAAANANANVIAAQENLTAPQIDKANQALLAAANIVAPGSAGTVSNLANSSGTTTSAVDPALAAAIVTSANQVSSAAAAANNAMVVCDSTMPAFQASAVQALNNAATADGAAASPTVAQTATQQDYDNVGAAIAAVMAANQTVASGPSANAATAATAATSATSAASTAATAATTAAATAAASAATAATSAASASAASDAAANAIGQADAAAKNANLAAAIANSTTAAAQASAALAAQVAAAPPVSPGTVLAAEAALQAQPQYRCILVQIGDEPYLNFKLSPDNQQPPIYFNLNIAEQVASANYLVASQLGVTPTTTGGGASLGFSNPIWEVQFGDTTTDNFGNPILPDASYQPYILTVLNDGADPSQFVNMLTTDIAACAIGTTAATATAAATTNTAANSPVNTSAAA